MKVTIEGVRCIDNDILETKINPSDARMLGDCKNNYGEYSVLMLIDCDFNFNAESKSITFSPKAAKIINIGNSDKMIIINGSSTAPREITDIKEGNSMEYATTGDKDFIGTLPYELETLGKTFLSEIRKHFRGSLEFYPKSKKYIESPDNFWTVKIQPRDKSLRITVRGRPETFDAPSNVVLKDDMAGYSTFKISSIEYVRDALAIIRQASQK